MTIKSNTSNVKDMFSKAETATLAEMLESVPERAWKTKGIIETAIRIHGEDARAIWSYGMGSYNNPRSNSYRKAKRAGFEDFVIYYGAKRQSPSDGWYLLIVENK